MVWARTRRHETESKDCNGSSVCRKGGYGRGIMSNPNPQSGLAPRRGQKNRRPPVKGAVCWLTGLGRWADLVIRISPGVESDHRGRIGLVDRHPIGHPTQPATVGVIRPKMDMALKRFAPIGGRKNLVCQNLISAARRKSSVSFQSYSGDRVYCSVIRRHHIPLSHRR